MHRYGDLFINLYACCVLKTIDPSCHLTFGINGNYRDCAPLFLDQDIIDRIHISHSPIGGFDAEDLKWLNDQRFTHVFDPMQDHNHSVPWWLTRNQPQEIAHIHGLPQIKNNPGKLTLSKWFKPSEGFGDYIAFHGFAGSYDPNNKKQFTPVRAQEIVNLIVSKGYKVLQLGLSPEIKLDNTIRFDNLDYFSSCRNVLGCRALVIGDSGMNWMASCYDFPVLGLYSHEYYDMGPYNGENRVSAIQPINPNAVYLSDKNVNDIPLEEISQNLDSLLS